jgi:hypothetical protein
MQRVTRSIHEPARRSGWPHHLPLLVGFGLVAAALIGWTVTVGSERPSHEREWIAEQAHLPAVRIHGDTVRVGNLRDFRHSAAGPPAVRWTEGVYDLSRLERVWFALSPFSPRFRGMAHPFLSFEFSDSQFVALSVEARKEIGEEYSVLKGLFRRYETMIVLGTEQDLLGLRGIAWDDPLYLYPVAVTAEQARELFLALLERAQQIEEAPEFYHTISNNCTTNLLAPVNQMTERKVRAVVGLLPGYSLDAAFARGWIDTDLPLGAARAAHRVNERIRAAIDSTDFSLRIRADH